MAGARGGRLEATFTVPSAVTITFDDNVSAAQVLTITAGDYTATTLTAFLTANVVGGGNWTFTLSSGETGTGRLMIDTSDRPYSVTWSTSALRTIMGFSADISAVSAAQTGTAHRGLWLAGVEKWTPHGDDDGNGSAFTEVGALRTMMAPTGEISALMGGSYKWYQAQWQGVTRARTKIVGESVTNESFERWWRDTQLGKLSYFQVCSKTRFYWDAGAGTYTQVRIPSIREFDPQRIVENWTGRYVVAIPRMVLVP